MNSISVLQWFNEHGIWIPGFYMSKGQCHTLWKNQTNESINGNRPENYAHKDLSMIKCMVDCIEPYMQKNYSILELGSNCGVNLNLLSSHDYSNLNGIEINPFAIEEMRKSFPLLKANIANISLEDGLKHIPESSFDLVFSMAVLIHIHPCSNFIFDEIARISKKYLCIVEGENFNCKYIFPRNYKRVFESRGYEQIKYIEKMPDANYTLRLFKKLHKKRYLKNDNDFPLIP